MTGETKTKVAVVCSQPSLGSAFMQGAKWDDGRWLYDEVTGNPGADEYLALVKARLPTFIFFPYWHWQVPEDLLKSAHCIGFHPTNLPYGRGGSPIQNLILRGVWETKLCMYHMTGEMDAGPVYRKTDLSLEGPAQHIYTELAHKAGEMARWLTDTYEADGCTLPGATPQRPIGPDDEVFKRRGPEDSRLDLATPDYEVANFIRMLDAPWLPHAFVEPRHGLKVEFTDVDTRHYQMTARAKFFFR